MWGIEELSVLSAPALFFSCESKTLLRLKKNEVYAREGSRGMG